MISDNYFIPLPFVILSVSKEFLRTSYHFERQRIIHERKQVFLWLAWTIRFTPHKECVQDDVWNVGVKL
jgi:hypothetical protein